MSDVNMTLECNHPNGPFDEDNPCPLKDNGVVCSNCIHSAEVEDLDD